MTYFMMFKNLSLRRLNLRTHLTFTKRGLPDRLKSEAVSWATLAALHRRGAILA